MARMSEMKFGDLQTDERYKKLERSLKLASLRKGNGKEDELLQLPVSPSISSINADLSDFSSNIPSLQTSRIGSEVVSSSNNLRNMLLNRKDINNHRKMIVTSSVKKFNEESDCRKDNLIMPPPKSVSQFHKRRKSNTTVTYDFAKPVPQNENVGSDIDSESAVEKQNYKSFNSNGKYNDTFSSLQINSIGYQSRSIRTFTKWKVVLNEQSHLVIKGTLECGKVVRSKPVIRRLTSTDVVSIFKHLYRLQGNIVDDEYELPDYVRCKFYNGFPDDWDNVCHIWRNFVQTGCNVTFRWPTPITDSDDDIKSEVTDITFSYSKSPIQKESNLKSFKEVRASEASFDAECTCNILRSNSVQNRNLHNCKKNDSSTQTCVSDTNQNLFHTGGNVRSSINQYSNDKENYKQEKNRNLNCCRVITTANELKYKLDFLVKSLTDKNHSQEYINKVTDMIYCLNYVASSSSITEDKPSVEDLEWEQDKHTIQEQNNKINEKSTEYVHSELIPLQNSIDIKVTDHNDLSQRKRTFAEMNRNNSSNSSGSESEIYTGIPKISIERILWKKKTILKPCKRKIRKDGIDHNYGTIKKQRTSNIPIIASGCVNESYMKSMRAKKVNDTDLNDSSVSVIEDEKDASKVKKYPSSNIQSSIDKHDEFDIVKRGQWDKLYEFTKDKNVDEMQERFVQENSTATHKPTVKLHHSYEVIKSDECKTNVPKEGKNKMIKADSCIETNNPKGTGNTNNQHENNLSCQQPEDLSSRSKNTINNLIKPVIISSIPVDIGIRSTQSERFLQNCRVNLTEDENKNIKELDRKVKHRNLIQKKSPIKSNSIRKVNSNSLSDCIKVQSNNMDSSISKKSSQDNLKVSQDNEPIHDYKPRLLSAWTPRVLYKSGLHLIFEGKLLNDAHHVVHRKFKTDIILRRISPKLIETVRHEFYQLIGDLNNTKHVVPKELLNQCRHGCPTKIEQFCKIWQSLQNATSGINTPDTTEISNDASMDAINVGISSKGRRIIPPLSYWTGERIVLKDNNPVYNPGTSINSLVTSSYESFGKSKHMKKSKQQKKDRSNKSSLDELENTTASSPEKWVKKIANDPRKVENNRSKEFATTNKRRTLQQASESSSSSDDESTSVNKNQKVKTTQQEPSNFLHVNVENSHELCAGVDTVKLIEKKLKERRSIEPNTSFVTSFNQMDHRASAEKYHALVCTYYQDIPIEDDVLSDDQVSHV